MSIENTQWADYDNRQTFDQLLQTLAPWGFVDSCYGNDCFPSISFLGHADKYFGIRIWVAHQDRLNRVDYGNSTTEETPQFVVESDFGDCDAVLGFHELFSETYYEGEEIWSVISVCTKLSPVYTMYTELVDRGFEVCSTGGGCSIWSKDIGDHTVWAGESLTANMVETSMDTDGYISVETYKEIGISINDEDGCAIDLDHGENFMCARIANMAAIRTALDTAEALAEERALGKQDLLADMSKVYNDILTKHFKGMKPMSADEMLMEYRDVMSVDQIKLTSSFIRFWEDLENMEGGRS